MTEVIAQELAYRPVTYKSLSRKMRVSDSAARALLAQYYEENNNVSAAYLVVGLHAHTEEKGGDYGEDDGTILVKLCKKHELEESKKLFSKVCSCWIYGLSEGDIDLGNLVAVNAIDDTEESCKTSGVIICKRKVKEDVSGVKAEPKSAPVAKKAPTATSKTTKSIPAKRSDPFAAYHARKAAEVGTKEKKAEAKRNRVVVDEAGEDNVVEKQEKALSAMFDDDEPFDDEPAEEVGDNIDTPEPEPEQKPSKTDEVAVKVEQEFLKGDKKPAAEPQTKTFVDENGYMVTVKSGKGKKQKKAKAKPKQSSLMSFFGKK